MKTESHCQKTRDPHNTYSHCGSQIICCMSEGQISYCTTRQEMIWGLVWRPIKLIFHLWARVQVLTASLLVLLPVRTSWKAVEDGSSARAPALTWQSWRERPAGDGPSPVHYSCVGSEPTCETSISACLSLAYLKRTKSRKRSFLFNNTESFS